MNKFRSQLVDRERSFFGPSLTSSSHTTSNTEKRSFGRESPNGGGQLSQWLDNINSPLVQDGDDGKVLKLRFDVTQYAPEEIVVKTIDNRLQVCVLIYIEPMIIACECVNDANVTQS